MLQNGTFSEPWRTLEADVGWLHNQEPAGWQLSLLRPGETLYDDPNSAVTGIPECVHKLSNQLPAHEQIGGSNALILRGSAVYKIFNSGAVFGASLTQTVTGLVPGSTGKLIVPIQVHLHGESDAYGAESGVWVNDEGGWAHGFKMGDRRWYRHKVEFVVPPDGTATVVIRVKSKWPRPKDFFIDDVVLKAEVDASANGGGVSAEVPTPQTVTIRVPDGFDVEQRPHPDANRVVVYLPPNVQLKIE